MSLPSGGQPPLMAENRFDARAEALISRIDREVRQRLDPLSLDAPAYAVVLAPLDDIYPFEIRLGLESDRQRALSSLDQLEAFSAVWQQYEFAIAEELDENEEFAQLITELEPELHLSEVEDGLDATQFVLYEVARRLTLAPPAVPVTDDFLLDSLRYSMSPELASLLRSKGLHPDDFERWARDWSTSEVVDSEP